MPNFSPTVAVLEISGGSTSFIPPRFSPGAAILHLSGGTPSWSVGAATSVTTPDLARLKRQLSYFDKNGFPTVQMQLHWQSTMEAIETAFAALTTDVDDLASIVARLSATEAQAASAVTTAQATESRVSLSDSYTNPTGVLTASSAGVVTIAAHSRVYGDGSSVSVNSGSVSGFASGQSVTVYYVDAGRAGGAVTYQGTTNAVAQSGNTHVVGTVIVPAAGAADATGIGTQAPGVPYSEEFERYREYITF